MLIKKIISFNVKIHVIVPSAATFRLLCTLSLCFLLALLRENEEAAGQVHQAYCKAISSCSFAGNL